MGLCANCDAERPEHGLVCTNCYAVLEVADDGYDPLLVDENGPLDSKLVRQRADLVVNELKPELPEETITHPNSPEGQRIRSRVRELVEADKELGTQQAQEIALQLVLDELFGFGPMGVFLRETNIRVPQVRAIYSLGFEPIVIEHTEGFTRTMVAFRNEEHLQGTLFRLLRILNAQPDVESGKFQGQFPNGVMLNIVGPPVGEQISVCVRLPGSKIGLEDR